MVATPFQNFQSSLKNKGFNYSPALMGQGQTDTGQQVIDKITGRKDAGQSIYSKQRQESTNRVASDLVGKSAGLKTDEFGRPNLQLGNFGQTATNQIKAVSQQGDLATQTVEARQAFKRATDLQNVGSYGFTGSVNVNSPDGSVIPGATSDNKGAQAAAMAMQASKNNVPYVWGGNSLANGIDCSGLVQQIYRRLGINVPRVTYDQAKNGKQIPVSQARPGDLVFYRPGQLGPEHVGIYVGNGKVVHAANPKLGTITSNLTNSNGAPLMIVRPY